MDDYKERFKSIIISENKKHLLKRGCGEKVIVMSLTSIEKLRELINEMSEEIQILKEGDKNA